MQNILLSALGTIIGGLVTWFTYRRAGQQLRDAAQEIQRLTTMILQGLENAHLVEVNWGPDGRALSITLTIRPDAAVAANWVVPASPLTGGATSAAGTSTTGKSG
jgi:hypothetical protein